jgi:hypothetical protein
LWASLQGDLCLFTLNFTHFKCYTVIRGGVVSSQAVHLRIQCVLEIVSGDGESALHRVCITCATTTTTNVWEPLQALPLSLADPVHSTATEGESRGCTGEFQGTARLHQASPRLHQLHLTLDTCKHRESWSGKCHICPLFLSLISTHTFSILFSQITF